MGWEALKMKKTETLPMETTGTQHIIDRTYRESGRYQWARETLINALEAGATKVEYGIEWQGVERKNVYRRLIADNGMGMSGDQLVAFFRNFGGSGKNIGGIHENFGVGSKTSLLPWNKHGLVVVSWVDGEASMIWLRRDHTTGEYGLRLFRAKNPEGEETLEAVVDPFEDPVSGVNWANIKPSWIGKHGTVIVLMGDSANQHTVLGNPDHDEGDLKGLASYLNRRVWEVPKGTEITVEELRSTDKKQWPKSKSEARGAGRAEIRTNRRIIAGSKFYIAYTGEKAKGKVGASGTLDLNDGTKLHWTLWEGDRPSISGYAANSGYIAALYKNELYDATSHLSTYRSFGVTDPGVRQRLWLVLEPALYSEETKKGVYPRTDRNTLLLRGGPDAGKPLPYADWGAEFADKMPDEVRTALKAAHKESGTLDDPQWRERLAERFGDRWRIPKMRTSSKGDLTVSPSQIGSDPIVVVASSKKHKPHEPRTANVTSGTGGHLNIGTIAGSAVASLHRTGVNIPTYRAATADELEPGMLAAWVGHDPEHPEGVVLLNVEHPVIDQQIKYWQEQYADHLVDEVQKEVIDVYGQVAVAKIAHSEKLKGTLPAEVVEKDLRSDHALTMGLLGLMAEESLIAGRLKGKFGKRRIQQHTETEQQAALH